jgi:hypothetical protein
MKVGFIDVTNFKYENYEIYNSQEKSGSRIEYSLTLNDDLINIGQQISTLPLKFASIVKANATSLGKDQEFHFDSKSGERALIYLTNVDTELNGPIEFLTGKVLGKKGTYVHYNANEIHRGCLSDIERYALALAFSESNEIITTIGSQYTEFKSFDGKFQDGQKGTVIFGKHNTTLKWSVYLFLLYGTEAESITNLNFDLVNYDLETGTEIGTPFLISSDGTISGEFKVYPANDFGYMNLNLVNPTYSMSRYEYENEIE